MKARVALLIAVLVAVGAVGQTARSRAAAARTRLPAIPMQPAIIPPPADRTPGGLDSRLEDKDGFLLAGNARLLDRYLDGLYDESGVDVRFIFARDVPDDLESFARQRARALAMGSRDDRRSLLFVYDIAGRRMRVEVGPGLEGLFPDGFVGYLMREQTAAFFASGDQMLGIKSTLFIVSNRLREAALREAYDPRAVTYITNPVRLAAGGGANARAEIGSTPGSLAAKVASMDMPARFGPQPTVEAAHARYLEALRDGYFQPNLPLYTPETEAVLRRFPIAAPYAQFILYSEIGREYTIVERGDLAILYFTSTPLVSFHTFRRTPSGWLVDIAGDVRNTREYVGRVYTWAMRESGDEYSRAFADQFGLYDGMRRPVHGDNRRLPTRASLE